MFLLESLNLRNHPQLGNFEIFFKDFTKNEINKDSIFSTVIIGNNGTGKSFLLKTIADIFREFQQFAKTGKRERYFDFDFDLRYSVGSITYEIISTSTVILPRSKQKKQYGYTLNRPIDVKVKDENGFGINKEYSVYIKELMFPEKVLVNSVMLNDRFTFANSESGDFYQYLGVRRTKSISSTKTFVRNSAKYLFESKGKPLFLDRFSEILEFMNFDKSCKVHYKTRYQKEFFDGKLTVKKLQDFYLDWETTTDRTTAPWGQTFFIKLLENNPKRLIKIVDNINEVASIDGRLEDIERSRSKKLVLDFFDSGIDYEEYEIVSDMDALNLINLDGLYLKKKKSSMAIHQTSSGEYHLILSLLGLYSRISDNSLVLIDEPEISLHPNWQMKYINFIKKMFHQFNNCHFILSSHSHFIISDLEPDSSSVVAIKRDINSIISSKLIDYSTYGWSAEQILLEVFETGTTRNYYLTEKLSEVFKLIAEEPNKRNVKEIKSLVEDIRNKNLVGISDADPLKDVLTKLLNSF